MSPAVPGIGAEALSMGSLLVCVRNQIHLVRFKIDWAFTLCLSP